MPSKIGALWMNNISIGTNEEGQDLHGESHFLQMYQ